MKLTEELIIKLFSTIKNRYIAALVTALAKSKVNDLTLCENVYNGSRLIVRKSDREVIAEFRETNGDYKLLYLSYALAL